MNKNQKLALKDDVSGRFDKAQGAIIAEYRGMTVGQLTDLRRALRASNAEFKIAKNRVAKKAFADKSDKPQDFGNHMKGPVGIIFIYGDVAAAAKSALKFEDENEKFSVKSALIADQVVSKAELKAISSLPSKEVLLSKIIGSIASPAQGLVSCLAGVQRNLVTCLAAIRDKKTA